MRDEEKAANLRKNKKKKTKKKNKTEQQIKPNKIKTNQIKHKTGSSNLKLVLSRSFPHF